MATKRNVQVGESSIEVTPTTNEKLLEVVSIPPNASEDWVLGNPPITLDTVVESPESSLLALVVNTMPGEVDSTITVRVDGVIVGTFGVVANMKRRRVSKTVVLLDSTLADKHQISYSIEGSSRTPASISATKYPLSNFPTWKSWQLAAAPPPWLAPIGSAVRLVATGKRSVVIRGVVSGWDRKTNRFTIDLVESIGDWVPYNSWILTLDTLGEGKPASVQSLYVVYEYDAAPEPAPILGLTPPKRRRIMM